MNTQQTLKILREAEKELETLLANTPDTISIGSKNNQTLICDALEDAQSAIRSLLMLEEIG